MVITCAMLGDKHASFPLSVHASTSHWTVPVHSMPLNVMLIVVEARGHRCAPPVSQCLRGIMGIVLCMVIERMALKAADHFLSLLTDEHFTIITLKK